MGEGLICPTGAPSKILSSGPAKNISLHGLVETALWIPVSRPIRGAFRDDRETPLCLGGTQESIKLFLPIREAKYFLLAHWTGFSTARPSGKSGLHPCPTRGPYSSISPGARSAAPHFGRNADIGCGPRSAI